MSTNTPPQTWDDERDGVFFRLTAHLFSGEFLAGASALLASYDVEVLPWPAGAGSLSTARVRAGDGDTRRTQSLALG